MSLQYKLNNFQSHCHFMLANQTHFHLNAFNMPCVELETISNSGVTGIFGRGGERRETSCVSRPCDFWCTVTKIYDGRLGETPIWKRRECSLKIFKMFFTPSCKRSQFYNDDIKFSYKAIKTIPLNNINAQISTWALIKIF